MKNRRFRILTLLFAIIMMFSTTSVYAQESATVRAVSRTISKDTVYSGTLAAGETHTYYFTPSYTGLFTVETFGTTDTYGTMSGNSVTTFPATASNDDGGEGTNFAIGFRQEAGNSTTITVRHFNRLDTLIAVQEPDLTPFKFEINGHKFTPLTTAAAILIQPVTLRHLILG